MDQQQAFPRLNTPFVDDKDMIGIPWYQLLITLWNRTGGATGGGNVPTGAMIIWSGDAGDLPDGYLLCDGTSVRVVDFPDLFSVIGRTWGAGDGVTTFGLPDLRNRFPIGADPKALASTGGSLSLALTVGQLPAHSHIVTDPGHTHVQDAHSHTQQVVNTGTAGVAGAQGANVTNNVSVGTTDATVAVNQNANTGVTIDNTGSGDPIDSTPAYAAVNYVIKS